MYSMLCSCTSMKAPIFCSKAVFLYLNKPVVCCTQRYSSSETHYDVLELKRNSSPKEIRSAFIRLSKEYHPDKNLNNPSLHEKFVKLNEAYSILNDINSRREYDSTLNMRVIKQRIYEQRATTYKATHDRPGDWKEYFDFEAEARRNEAIHIPQFLHKISQLSKAAIVMILLAIATGGFFLQIGLVQFSKSLPREVMNAKDMEIARNLMIARSDAQKYELQENIERFTKRVAELKKNSKSDL